MRGRLGAELQRADNVGIGNENRIRSYLHTRCADDVTTAIILIHHPDPFGDSLRSSQDIRREDHRVREGFRVILLGGKGEGVLSLNYKPSCSYNNTTLLHHHLLPLN